MLRYGDLSPLMDNLEQGARNRLRNHLERVVRGSPDDVCTPFFPKEQRNRPSAYARGILDKLALTRFDELNDIELREMEKFGPFSIMDPWSMRRAHFESYFTQGEVADEATLGLAVRRMSTLIKNELHALPVDIAYANLPSGTNLGLPSFTSEASERPEYLKRARYLAAGGYRDFAVFPSVIFWRGQPNGNQEHIKNRDVMGFDHLETIIALRYQPVVLDALRHTEAFMAWNDLDYVDAGMTHILNTNGDRDIISVDFSGFDASVPGKLIHAAFDVLRSWFVEKDHAGLNWLERVCIETGVVTPDGLALGRTGGVPSGLGFTNLIDCLCHMLIWYCVEQELGLHIRNLTVLGDDGVIVFEEGFSDMELISDYVSGQFGMSVSADKGGVSKTSVRYLQRLHLREYQPDGYNRGIRSIMRTWNGVCHLEHWDEGLPPAFFSARAIMQIEQAQWHPNFHLLVKHYFSSDKFVREFDPTQIFSMAGGSGKVEEVLKLRSFRSGVELPSQGLNKFETVVELRKLRKAAA